MLCRGTDPVDDLNIRYGDDIRRALQAWKTRVGEDTYRDCELVFNCSANGNILDEVVSQESGRILDGVQRQHRQYLELRRDERSLPDTYFRALHGHLLAVVRGASTGSKWPAQWSPFMDNTQLLLHTPLGHEDYWFLATVVKTSSPNVVGNYAFPGIESALSMVQFRFKEGRLQVLDARQMQPDDPNNPNDDAATRTERVLFEFTGYPCRRC